ncbi:cytochrome c heme-lyase [Cavenderia fasciculata]|uniref:Holocytochrome c-type synthase n=1 Tax=Cavenderia fasciculata TaxID=261658 RepID=F4PVA6_CACFS|nr:cytochrome c heme-lyase [Cavenderia fasciculata]EGG19920.1 cytochrome c heme-lyase [Cavenderia fasciculata]|eukprot:XP_004366903.1 cytochrome c heme-lyase [Cavenderia fasciculata]
MDEETRKNALAGGCPVAHEPTTATPKDINPNNNMYRPNQKPHVDQTLPLDTSRVKSSIPRTEQDQWEYPSPQMFFNAMKRKQYQPSEKDMDMVVAIHNTVNEKCWEHVLDWEKEYSSECDKPKLVKFRGRAKDFSPKARILNFFGYTLPFDRHDWIIDRCGKQVRYVIDFYEGKADKENNKPIGIYLDVRPAIDDFQTFTDRFKKLFN